MRKQIHIWLTPLIPLVLTTLLFAAPTTETVTLTPEITLLSDTLYKSGELTNDEKALCRLDVYAPKAAKNLPVLVWLHGGGMTGGDKATRITSRLSRALANEGLIVVSANYRLNPKVSFPAYVEDVAAATAWTRMNATNYGGDPKRVFIGGHSAGAYLAALVATDGRYLKPHGFSPAELGGLIALSGQMTTHFTVCNERGLPEDSLLIDAAAPLFHWRGITIPVLLMYGENDMALRAEENALFAAAIRRNKNTAVRYLEIKGRDHGGMIGHMAEINDPIRLEIMNAIRTREERQ
jgi:acetyl esterase/lipase